MYVYVCAQDLGCDLGYDLGYDLTHRPLPAHTLIYHTSIRAQTVIFIRITFYTSSIYSIPFASHIAHLARYIITYVVWKQSS